MTLKHYKQIVKDKIVTDTDNPQNWRIKKWLGDETIHIKRLLNDMVREGLITIHYEEDRGKVKRIIKNKMNVE